MSILMNREHVKEVFRIYTDHYDSTDEKVRLKIDHTYRVAELCERIALSAGLREEADLAWLTGMLPISDALSSFGVLAPLWMPNPSIMRRWGETSCSGKE